MTAIVWDSKAPGETWLGELDWSKDLAVGDTISSSTWSIVTTDGGNISLGTNAFLTTLTNVMVSGGTDKFNYELQNTVTTVGGETLIAVVMLPVRART